MKRSKPQGVGSGDDDGDDDDMSSEMDVDNGEAKNDDTDRVNQDDDDDDDDDGDDDDASETDKDDDNEDEEEDLPEKQSEGNKEERSEFLDAFYGLASTDPRERSVAGQVILHHAVIFGPTITGNNVQDAAYTFKRLLNGVCSGRAAARQGNASTLASFLKLSKQNGVLAQIQQQEQQPNNNISLLAFVRQKLIQATSLDINGGGTTRGRKKPSEIKDHNFGRLYGVLAVVRSSILLPTSESNSKEQGEILETTKGFLSDLHDLYDFKPYMREPAAHAVCTLLNLFFKAPTFPKAAVKVATQLVEQCIIPLFLEKGDLVQEGEKDKHDVPLVATYSTEQIALALDIQSFAPSSPSLAKLLKESPLKDPVLTKDSIPVVATTLAETCAVNPPRTHLVWDTLWLYLTEPLSKTASRSTTVDERTLRHTKMFFGTEPAQDVVESIMNNVVAKELVGIGQSEEKGEGRATTHEQKALALTLLRILSGVDFVSSLAGRTVLVLSSSCLESCVYEVAVLRRVLIHVMGGAPGKKNQEDQKLKPLATDSLNRMVQAASARPETKLALVKALVCCDARLDGKTKSTAVHDLLGYTVSDDKEISKEQQELWTEFIAFAQGRILLAEEQDNEGEDDVALPTDKTAKVLPYEAEGLVDLLFRLTKRIIRINSNATDNENLIQFREESIRQMLSFMLASSFAQPTKGSRGGNQKTSSAKEIAANMDWPLPFSTRKVILARLFSFLSECATAAYSAAHDSPKSAMREIEMFKPFLHTMEEFRNLEEQFGSAMETETSEIAKEEEDDEEELDSIEAVSEILSSAKKTVGRVKSSPSQQERFTVSLGMLVSFLYLCLVTGSDPKDELGELSGMVDVNDSDEIKSLIEETKGCFDTILMDENSDENRLSRLIALCINLMSWESEDEHGASKHLIREIVKVVLPSGLMALANSSKAAKLDNEVFQMMMQAVGAEESGREEEEDGVNEGDEEDEDGTDNVDESDPFTKPPGESLSEDDNEEEGDSDEEEGEKGGGEEEIILDHDRLNSMLEEDSDMDIDENELEHHEGADSALANLIKRKQEARKAGRAAKERVELSRQIRCISVLEILTNGKLESWGPLLRCDILMSMVSSLLTRISQLDKASAKGKGSDHCASEREALSNKLASYLGCKLLKSKMGNLAWNEDINVKEHCRAVIGQVMLTVQFATFSESHRFLCYQALPTLLRCVPSYDARLELASELYGKAAEEWSTKKSTRISSKLFDELIHKDVVLAQHILVEPLSKSVPAARVRFLRSECFRLLAELYNPKINKGSNHQEQQALDKMLNAREVFIEAAVLALNNSDTTKSKWAKDVIGTIEKVVCFESPHGPDPKPISAMKLESLEAALRSVAEKTENENAKKNCQSLLVKVEALKQVTSAVEAKEEDSSPQDNNKKRKKNKKKKK